MGQLTLKQQFEGEDNIEVDYEGIFETSNEVKGTYKSNKTDEFDAAGIFELKITQ